MTTARLAMLAALALILPACGGGSDSAPPPAPLAINASGGSVSGPPTTSGGGAGAKVTLAATGHINIGASALAPTAPAAPTPPSTGTELTNALITAATPIAGNVRVSSTLQIAAGVNPAVVTSSTGDIVIAGSLIGEHSAGTTTNGITLNAPAGTIYILGSLITQGKTGAPDNPNGGAVLLNAQRVVVLGMIDTGGEAAVGGNGGAITLDTTGGGGTDLLVLGGLLRSWGGTGTLLGGQGGAVTLQAGALLGLFGPVQTWGGDASTFGAQPVGGKGGDVTIGGNSAVDVAADISLNGGAGSAYDQSAQGGAGGVFTASKAVPYRITGSILTAGGAASTQASNPFSLVGGTGGAVNIGVGTPVASLDLGPGSCTTQGGWGSLNGGSSGDFDVSSLDGNISVSGSLYAGGGPARAVGGDGGAITIRTDFSGTGNTSNHTLSITGALNSNGGDLSGAGKPVLLSCGGDFGLNGTIDSSGGNASSSPPANGGAVTISIAAANTVPAGKISVSGSIQARAGGSPTTPYGFGGPLTLTAATGISCAGTLSTAGGIGTILLQGGTGDIDVSGSVLSNGLNGAGNNGNQGGDITLLTSGNVRITALMNASGGSAPGGSNTTGAASGAIAVTSTGALGAVTLFLGTELHANGGNSQPGSLNPPGGAAGIITMSTVDQPISITGRIFARGGTSSGGAGGLGGQVVVNSDSDANGTGGNITLSAASQIDVSGGSGFTGGSARNNAGVPPANSNVATLAVVFDAAGGLTGSPDGGNEGMIRNFGVIIAMGSSPVARGGDVWLDGRNSLGTDLTAGDGGTQVLTGAIAGGVFYPN